MPIITGTDNVSPEQLRYLGMAKSSPPAGVLADILFRVAADEDITSGSESLHPDWAPIFQENRAELARIFPREQVLRIENAFTQIEPFDPDVSELDPQSVKLTFLLGAGASKPEPSGIPTVKELLPDLLERARRLDRPDVTHLADFCDTARIGNIEDLLTAAQIAAFCSRNPNILGLVDFLFRGAPVEERFSRRRRSIVDLSSVANLSSVAFLQDTLQLLFSLLSSRMLPAKPNKGHEAIAEYVKKQAGAAIVTTNYDCCMDLALGQEERDFSYTIDFSNTQGALENNSELTRLLKLHGSLNWFYCETCQQVYLIDITQTVSDYLEDRDLYPVIAICKVCGGQQRGLLVPPLAMKFDIAPPLNSLLDKAQEAFNTADIVVVVGFSFADADLYISRMLIKWMQTSEDAKLVIFDPDQAVQKKVRRQFSLRIPGFDETRILRVSGDCSETLPKFLSGQLRAEKQQKKARKKATKPSDSTQPEESE